MLFVPGVSLNLHTMYIGECAPQSKRGMVTVSVSFAIAFGKLMGFVIGLRYCQYKSLKEFMLSPCIHDMLANSLLEATD